MDLVHSFGKIPWLKLALHSLTKNGKITRSVDLRNSFITSSAPAAFPLLSLRMEIESVMNE